MAVISSTSITSRIVQSTQIANKLLDKIKISVVCMYTELLFLWPIYNSDSVTPNYLGIAITVQNKNKFMTN